MALLETKKLRKNFGGLVAIQGLDVAVNQGEILGLIGPNGSGKTTFFNLISGIFKPTRGTIIFKGKDITGLPSNRIAKMGMGRTFQSTTLFKDETVLTNVEVGHHLLSKAGIGWDFFSTAHARRDKEDILKKSMELLEFMGLAAMQDELAKNLPHGHQRVLGVCIGLAIQPELLVLDEPVTGMNPEETSSMMKLLRKIRDDRGITIILVEHDMSAVMGLSDRMVVLNYGRKIAEGPPKEIRDNRAVIEAYLGTEEGD